MNEFDLTTATTEELIDELQSRHDVMAFVGFKETMLSPEPDEKFGDVAQRYKGPAFAVLGLLAWVHELKKYAITEED